MDLTTVDRVKRRLSLTDSDLQYDALLAALVSRTSAEAERLMNRLVLSAARTTQHDYTPGMTSLSLPGYPVTSVTDVRYDLDRTFGSSTIIDATTLYTDTASGLIHFEVLQIPGRGVVQVTYTGGMASDTSAFIGAYPDIAEAVDMRCAQLWQRRDEIGLTGVSGSQGSISRVNEDWAPDAMEIIRRHRRWSR